MADSPDILTPFLQYGPVGLMVVMFLVGWLIPKWAYETLKADRDQWRLACETERVAHQITRDALIESGARGGVAVETAKTAVSLLQGLDHPTVRGA